VYREAGATEDIIWRIHPADPSQREELVKLPHREGFPVIASLSPDGRLLAYLSQGDNAVSEQSSQADVFIHDLARKETTKLVSGIDYQFRPIWSPDSQLLYMRRYAGPDILSSEGSIIYMRIARLPAPDEPQPTRTPRPTPTPTLAPGVTPTPTLAPGETPTPTPVPEDPVKVVLKARYSQVQAWIPLGFAPDNKSMYFAQVNGGLTGVTLIGALSPATTASIDEARAQWQVQFDQIVQMFPTPAPDATPLPPESPPTPTLPPSPTPVSRLVVELTNQTADDYAISPDLSKVVFRAGVLSEGEFLNRTFYADLVASKVQSLPTEGLISGDQIGPAWHPDSQHVAIGVVPASGGGAATVVLLDLGGGPPGFLPPASSGFDVPRSFSPDGVWLAASHFGGESLVEPGEPSLTLIAPTGQRVAVATGSSYANGDAIIAWVPAPPPPPPPPSPSP
jgi:hypothetical protein